MVRCKDLKYEIIKSEFGMPPVGSIVEWDNLNDSWVVKDAYFIGSISFWSGDPALLPKLYKPINRFEPHKKLKKHGF